MAQSSPTEAATGASEAASPELRMLERIMKRLDHLEARIDSIADTVTTQGTAGVAMVVDSVDQIAAQLADEGADVDSRLRALVPMLLELTKPEHLEATQRLIQHLPEVADLAEMVPGTIAMLVDNLDQLSNRIATDGPSVDERLRAGLELLLKVTEPENIEATQRLVAHLPEVADLADMAPGAVATVVDSVDGLVAHAASRGLDVDHMVNHLVKGLTSLVDLIESGAVDDLVDSGVLSPEVLRLAGGAARSLVECEHDGTKSVGVIGAMFAASNPDVKRALGFGLAFAQHFGQQLNRGSVHAASPAQLKANQG